MIQTHNKACTGCTACYAICPTKSITMEADEEGFLFPLIEQHSCIGCNKCEEVCPLGNPPKYEYHDYCYIAVIDNDEILANCSSGGVFPALADYALAKGGFVCGCVLDEECIVRHTISNDPNDIKEMYKSKYVQSDLGDCFASVKELLDSGEFLLFTGTPCQVGGLRSFLGREYDNLLTMDFACHGVPSPELFKQYVQEVKSANNDVKTFWFRNKMFGWRKSVAMTWADESGNVIKYIPPSEDSFWKEFAAYNNLRNSCAVCEFCTPQRSADITVGDHWNIRNSPYYDPKGVSFILCNTPKALLWLQENEDYFRTLERITLKNVCQPHFWRPYVQGKKRTEIFENLQRIKHNEN